ncbi:hypothetical protein EVAR_97755_1 [Eumeta japonica]|uniref:Uncharacterized protein n=1 Tax=Eumeta variegata TaxID=151549 RepID=A0A4C1X7W1_EUMVA|nr:hypothetical protein EVAR_97755_1 [Eumeta japonica]
MRMGPARRGVKARLETIRFLSLRLLSRKKDSRGCYVSTAGFGRGLRGVRRAADGGCGSMLERPKWKSSVPKIMNIDTGCSIIDIRHCDFIKISICMRAVLVATLELRKIGNNRKNIERYRAYIRILKPLCHLITDHVRDRKKQLSAVVVAAIRDTGLEILEHLPYSSDLAPSDSHQFLRLEEYLNGQIFEDDEVVVVAVREFLDAKDEVFF